MYIKKYIYSSNEELMKDNEYLKINLNKVLEYRKIQLEMDFPCVEENDKITNLNLKLILPYTMTTTGYSVFRQVGTDNYSNDVLTTVNSETTTIGGIEYPTILINLEHIDFSYDNKLIVKLYLDEYLDEQERQFIEENKIVEIYMETVQYQGVGMSSKVDPYEIGKATLNINRLDGKVMYNIHLLQTLNKKLPISLALIGGNNSITTEEPIISNNLLFSFQKRIVKLEYEEEITIENDSENSSTELIIKKAIEVLDSMNTKALYIYIKDLENSKYKKLISHDVVADSEVYFNSMDGSYICNYKSENNDEIFKLVYKDGSSRLYENSNNKTKLLKEIDIYNRETLYTWTGDKLDSITNHKQEIVTLVYSANDYLSSITYNGGSIEFVYEENKLRIEYYNNLGTLVDYLVLSYDNDKLVMVGTKRNNNKLLVEYVDNKVSKVKMVNRVSTGITPIGPINPGLLSIEENTPLGNISSYTDTPIYYYDYTYGDCYTKVTSFTNEATHTYFDNFGRVKLETDDYGHTINYDYVGNTEYLNSKSMSVCSKRILINNNSFEEDEDNLRHWAIMPLNTSWVIANEGLYGKCLKIYKKNSETPKISQVLKNIELPLNKITFFAKKKGSGTINIKCQLKKIDALDSEYNLEKARQFTLYTTWTKYTLDLSSVTNEEGLVSERELSFEIIGDSENEVYIDEINYNDQDRITRTNLLIDGNMDSLAGWTFETEGGEPNYSLEENLSMEHTKCIGTKICCIRSMNKVNTMRQIILKTGVKNEKYLLSALLKSDYIPISDLNSNKIYIKFVNGSEEDLHEFAISTNMKNWQVLSKTVVSNIEYSSIEVGIKFIGVGSMLIGSVQLLNNIENTYYHYDEKFNITEILDTNGDNLLLKYDDKNKIKFISSKNNQGIYYFYDENGKLKRIKNSKNAMIILEYDEDDNINKQIFTINGTIKYTINSNYDNNSNEIFNSINNSNITRREFNTLGDLAKITTANNVATNYGYNIYREVNLISSIVNDDGYTNQISYNNYGEVKTITSQDGKVYAFTYDDLGKLKSVAIDGVIISSFTYGDIVNGVNTGLVTQKTYDSSNIYSFEYDDLKRITNIKYNSYIIVKYEYDENGNISKVEDMINDITNYYTYDYEGKLVKLLSSYNEYNYEYDNQNNIQSVNYNILNNYRHIDYEYNYERDKLSFEYYVNKMLTKYNKEVVTANSEGNGYIDLIPVANTAETTIDNGFNVLNFSKNNQMIKYEFNDDVSELATRSINNVLKRGAGLDDEESLSAKPIMSLWIKPKTNTNDDDQLFIGYTNLIVAQNSYETFKLALDENGYLHLVTINQYGSEDEESCIPIIWNKWNYLVIEDSKIYLNGKNEIFNHSFSVGTLSKLCIGEQETYNESSTRCSFKVAFIMYGKYEQETDINIDYVEGLKALNQNTGAILDKTTYLESAFNNKYEVYPLNGSIMSNRSNKSKSNIKDNYSLFEYDNELKQYVYSSYCYKDTSLIVKPGVKDKGFVSIKFKLDGLSDYTSLSVEDETYPFNKSTRAIMDYGYLKIYLVNNCNLEIFSFEGNSVVQCGELESDRWYILTIFNGDENSNNSAIYLDNTLLAAYTTLQFDESSKLYIGTFDTKKAQLDGWFSSLVIKDGVVSTSARSSVLNELMSQHKIEYIQNSDALGQVTSKGIKVNDNVLMTTNYTYSGVKLAQENLSIYNEKRVYTYDNMNNVVRIVKTSALGNRTYAYNYDGFGRLVNVNDGNNNILMIYDDHGNILKRQQAQISAQGMTQNEIFSYDAKNRLRILRINNSNGQEEYKLQYDSNKYSPNKIIKILNGAEVESKDIAYEGKRVKSIGKIGFYYNEEGIRIRKVKYLDDELTIPEEEHNYILEGDRILTEYIITSTEQHRLDYNYDINGELVSVEYGGNVYYYVRDVLGNINHIIDSNRNIVVSYEYNEWGKVSKTIRVANCLLGELNPFMYKGYYYDVETQLFYCNSRYYSPELCRWISPDSIEYLDPKSINGLNLYCYCYNNPISYADPSGNLPFFILTAIIGAVIGVGITAAVDYIPDKEFDLHWGWYVGAGVLGAAIGAGIGMAVSYYATGSIASSTGQVFTSLFKSTSLYRSVGPDELADLKATGKFRQGPNSMEGKFFANSKNGAMKWGKSFNQSSYVKIRVPKSSLSNSSVNAMKYLDAIDDAFYFSDLGYLNSIAGKIWFL